MNKRDYYEVLGLQKGAGVEDVKKAYKKLARKFHPDMNPGNRAAEERFKELNEANEVLSDPEKKARYDRWGFAGVDPNFDPEAAERARSGFGGGTQVEFGDLGDLGDLFGNLFGGHGGFHNNFHGGFHNARTVWQEPPVRQEPMTVDLSFAEAALGCEKSIKLERVESCAECGGNGRSGGGICRVCDGKGKVRRRRTTKFTVPAGTQSGTGFRLRTPAGELPVTVRVETPRNLSREQAELLRRFDASLHAGNGGTRRAG